MSKHGKKPPRRSSKVLDGYKKIKGKLVPPMMNMPVPLTFVSYGRQTLPELIWWDVIADQVSTSFSLKLASEIGSYFKSSPRGSWWAFISDFRELTDVEFEAFKEHLAGIGVLEQLQTALSKFVALYPDCPLARLFSIKPAQQEGYLERFEWRLKLLEDKTSKEGILLQGHAIYSAVACGKLKARTGDPIADIHEIENYPQTERSLQVGGAIRALLNMMAAQMLPAYSEDSWAIYFWERSLSLRPLNFEHIGAYE